MGRFWIAIALTATVSASCATGGPRGPFGQPSYSVSTFESWVLSSGLVATGSIVEVDPEILVDDNGFSLQRVTFAIDSVVRANQDSYSVGETAPLFLHGERPGLFFEVSDVGAELLIVAGPKKSVPVPGRGWLEGAGIITSATYQLVTVNGARWGVRLVLRPWFEDYGYRGDRQERIAMLRAGRTMRPVDASLLTDLVRRAQKPSTRTEKHLGYAEIVEADTPRPAVGDPDTDPT